VEIPKTTQLQKFPDKYRSACSNTSVSTQKPLLNFLCWKGLDSGLVSFNRKHNDSKRIESQTNLRKIHQKKIGLEGAA